jgi:hypothetical protein
MHDFDIALTDGRIVALEVTSAVDGSVIELHNTAFARAWLIPELQLDWWIGIPRESGTIPLRKSRSALIAVLRCFQAHGLTAVAPDWVEYGIPSTLPAAVIQAVETLFQLGADWARSTDRGRDSTAQLHFFFHGAASANFDQLHQLMLERVEAKRLKLLRANAHERHIFVWLDNTYPDAELAVATLPPPSSAPTLPAQVDAVWLATPPFGDPERVWLLRPSDGWCVIK